MGIGFCFSVLLSVFAPSCCAKSGFESFGARKPCVCINESNLEFLRPKHITYQSHTNINFEERQQSLHYDGGTLNY